METSVRKYLVAAVQMDVQNNKDENLKEACRYIDEAAAKGARLVVFPETMNIVGDNVGDGGQNETIPGYTTEILAQKAREHRIYIHCGSIPELEPKEKRHFNTSVMLDPNGEIIAKYQKIHTFDVTLPNGTPVMESDNVIPGSRVVTVETELGVFGFTICYDMRFPELYRLMALRGAQVIFAPADFTMPTGKDHWEPVLRTRAIENGCYIVAPDQIGQKPKFVAYGNSMVIDPWGTVIARAKDEPGLILAEIDLDYEDRIRQKIPSLKNRRIDVYRVLEQETAHNA